MIPPPQGNAPRPDGSDRVVVIAAVLGLIGVSLALRTIVALRSTATVEPALQGIDPNTATWSDLALLPEIGEQTAQTIIAYREDQGRRPSSNGGICVFRNSNDLLPVKGIGPKTLAAIAPHLRFDSCP